jgi:hypothetical protein
MMDERIEAMREALAVFDKEQTVRYLWPVLDAARAIVQEYDSTT